jgi:alpha-glucosidase
MRILDVIRALQLFGPGEGIQAIRYALYKRRMDENLIATSDVRPQGSPGQVSEVEPLPSGAVFRFQSIELNIRFLEQGIGRILWEMMGEDESDHIHKNNQHTLETSLSECSGGWCLESEFLKVVVQSNGGIRYLNPAGRLIRQELPPVWEGDRWIHRSVLRPEEHIFGLGERAASFNLRGGEYQMWNRDPGGSYGPGKDPLYLCIPVYLGLHKDGGYLIFYDNSYPSTFIFDPQPTDVGTNEIESFSEVRFGGGSLHYYLIPGSPEGALKRYSDLTGRPPLPPRWALGYHQSRWGYKSEAEVKAIVAGFRKHNLPLSALHLDIDYMDGYRVFTVDQERFPDLGSLVQDLESQGIRIVVIIDPGVKRDEDFELYQEGLQKDFFLTLPDGNHSVGLVWPGSCAFPDFGDVGVREWWGEKYERFIRCGISGYWHDMNEPTVFTAWGDSSLPLSTCHKMDGRMGDHREGHNLYGLYMNQAGYEAIRKLQPEKRPFLLSRSGWAGMQKVAWNWTGDIDSSWEALRQTVPTVLGLGCSGIPYSGPDIGGFSGAPSSELYLRWFQLAAFLPFFRTHSAFYTPPREPWTFDEPFLTIIRNFMHLRVQLMPYLYTLAWQTSQTGLPLVRPLFWGEENHPDLWDVEDAFLLGNSILVAPILEEGVSSRTVSLPHGSWVEFWTDRSIEGPGQMTLDAPLDWIPILIRSGCILPMEDDGQLTLHIYPSATGESHGMLYNDEGDGYQSWRVDRFKLMRDSGKFVLSWEKEGEYPFPFQNIHLRLHGMTFQQVNVDGVEGVHEGSRITVNEFDRVSFISQ